MKMLKLSSLSALLFLFSFAVMGISSRAYAQADILINPPCGNSTCISAEAIMIANNIEVEFDPMLSYFDNLSYEEPCEGVPPDPTGVTVYKQMQGELLEFPDTFCTMQGCTAGGNEEGRICF